MDETSKKKEAFSKKEKNKKRIVITSLAVLLLGGAGVVGYQTFMAPAQAETAYQVIHVGKGDVSETVLASGTVQASKRTSLSFADAEDAKDVISSILVQVGDHVKAGQVLATMDDSVAKMQLINAQANLLSAQAKLEEAQKSKSTGEMSTLQASVNQTKSELEMAGKSVDLEKARNDELKAKANLEKAEKNYVSQKMLFEAEAISRTEYETAEIDLEQAKRDYQTAVLSLEQTGGQAKNKVEQAQAAYQIAVENLEEAQKGPDSATILSAKAAVEQAKAQLQQNQTALNAVTLKAPMDGVIVQLNGNVGEVPSNNFIIMDNSNSGDLEVLAQISESDIGKVKEDLKVTFTTNSYPDQEFEGKVKLIYPEAVTNSGVTTYDVLLSVDNQEGLLKIGMTMNVTIEIGTHTDVLVIPASALQSRNGRDGVLLMNNGTAAPSGNEQPRQAQQGQPTDQQQQPQQRQEARREGTAEQRSNLPYRFQPVKIGYFASDRVEITEGLSEGDQIVILPTAGSAGSANQNGMRMGGMPGMGGFPGGGGVMRGR
ncbi:efflux RND transporter periplasmic adaptor subunit [Brevibacillus invocatus]|uniref:efflux RND transporter periplasmic adaptor subunit n=1 Tax=Brevibacillus invocatus TaxID=173959 RepID=UPI00203F9F6A|nr:efflux RND transporter periplasmic adaptor subunit [Brevibacillus invocatus]MCM3432250.1 efflux RND transporter periplasmic adaptor subunit [Brevibacillus invocatus]